MKHLKKAFAIVFVIVMSLAMSGIAFASEQENSVSSSTSKINAIYNDIFNMCSSSAYDTVEDDYSAYSYLLENKELVTSTSPVMFSSEIYADLEESEKTIINGFLLKINTLLEIDAIAVNENLLFTMPEPSVFQEKTMPYATVINIMSETRSHAKALKKVFDNAPFGTRHIVAGTYFTERVKQGAFGTISNI